MKYQNVVARLEDRKRLATAAAEKGIVGVQVPIIKKIDSGLSRRTYKWSVYFYVNGLQKMKSTGTNSVKEARKIRDKFYAELLAAGATVKPSHHGKARVYKKTRKTVNK